MLWGSAQRSMTGSGRCLILKHAIVQICTPHGIAVGLGMLVEAEISHCLGYLSWSDVEAHRNLLKLDRVPTTISHLYHSRDILDVIRHDNKRGYLPEQHGKRPLTLLDGLGKPHRTG